MGTGEMKALAAKSGSEFDSELASTCVPRHSDHPTHKCKTFENKLG